MIRILTVARVVWLDVIRRKDVYVLLILLAILLLALVSMNLFGFGGATAYVADIGLLMSWLFAWVLSLSIGCRLLPQEESRGTIFALLAKPVTRLELIVGKWLGACSVVGLATVCFYALVFGVSMLRGWSLPIVVALQAVALHAGVIGMIVAIAIMFSTRLNSDASATLAGALTATSFLVVPRIPEFVAQAGQLRGGILLFLYNLLPHFEIFDLRMRVLHGYAAVPAGTFALVLGYGVLVTTICLAIGWAAYRHKRFTRGSLSGY
ncbi:MAG: ABC transporter permease [Lentisphaerae bacterium]|nr:ABC transporter permease [Lentisphaerota bacterium]